MYFGEKTLWTVYLLIDPRNGEIRYVGCTHNPRIRFLGHLSQARTGGKSPKAKWIKELLRKGLKPQLVPLVKTESWRHHRGLEETWIYRLGLAGCDLLTGGSRERLLAKGIIRPDQRKFGTKVESYYKGCGYRRLVWAK
jgi:hypothetical protein